MSELQKISNNIKDKAMQELASVMEDIYQTTIVNFKKSTIPEVVFKEYFLDFFKSGMNTPDKDLKYAKWIELSKSPYNEVDVIDNKGNIIFTTPPLFAKPVIDPSIIDINFSNIGSTYMMKSNRLQADADNYLAAKLAPLENKVSADTENIISRWQNIFVMYSNAETMTKPNVDLPYLPESDLDDDIEY